MKRMTCRQLGGACDQEFFADTFEEMAKQSQAHGKEMFQKQDMAHLQAMQTMQKMMQSQDDFQNWFRSKQHEFDALVDIIN
ncbi:MAG: hypothetical protein KDC28_05930 [Saprospiraceae bacterium]|nr:hypothetical protein [Saprospiraceae bacterium]MCB9320078.1 DUF1059 domain-containing protein [Lewinellaceae bacterium]